MAEVKSKESLYREIVLTYGNDLQLAKLAEELTEAGAAIQSWRNAVAAKARSEVIRKKKKRAHEEIADALFCIAQMEFLSLDNDQIDHKLNLISEVMMTKLEEFKSQRGKL